MKIVIILAALVSLTFVSSNLFSTSEGICKDSEVRVTSTLQKTPQSFTLDFKKLKTVNIRDRENDFTSKNLIPIEEVGLVLEKLESSLTLDATHNRYFRNEAKSVWLPYSHTGEWTRNANIISNQMMRTSASKTETPLVSFEFIFDSELKSVTDEDLNNILSWLKINSNKRKVIKTNIKNNILKYQNDYMNGKTSVTQMKTTNTNTQTEITRITNEISKITTEITTLEVKLKTVKTEVTTQTTNLNGVNEEINAVIAKLEIAKAELVLQTKLLNEYKITDTKQLEIEFNSALVNIKLPQTAPERFLEEYAISTQYNYVKSAYDLCIPSKDKWMACWNSIKQSHKLKKKLRRRFF